MNGTGLFSVEKSQANVSINKLHLKTLDIHKWHRSINPPILEPAENVFFALLLV
jgi:hypothetical protein